ncbi:hypothetical protein XHC_3715 [Xanthomonas hortorum pv. carotae str. M081]|nr:hypothetical protein XHC_3715 [Xanthomonas hortorum pv. carotae str. M081]
MPGSAIGCIAGVLTLAIASMTVTGTEGSVRVMVYRNQRCGSCTNFNAGHERCVPRTLITSRQPGLRVVASFRCDQKLG